MQIKRIGVFTSGGDSPGMNASIRAVVRASIYNKIGVTGIFRGYKGMISDDMSDLNVRSVSNIIQRGGTILKTSRCMEFFDKQERKKAFNNLVKNKVDALVAIGGDGTFSGANIFSTEYNIPVIGIPGTIDNDLYGTDYTVGFDTATNTAIDAIDKIRDTAASHDRLFIIEVMGKDSGYIALYSGIGGGAESVLLPETISDIPTVVDSLNAGSKRGKSSNIIVVAEGDEEGGAIEIAKKIKAINPAINTRVTILGHIQRGGSPSCADRVLGTRMGVAAVEAIINGQRNVMVGVLNNKMSFTSFEKATKEHNKMNPEMIKCVKITSI
jgi:6-phosphofructokinase 1